MTHPLAHNVWFSTINMCRRLVVVEEIMRMWATTNLIRHNTEEREKSFETFLTGAFVCAFVFYCGPALIIFSRWERRRAKAHNRVVSTWFIVPIAMFSFYSIIMGISCAPTTIRENLISKVWEPLKLQRFANFSASLIYRFPRTWWNSPDNCDAITEL